MKRLLIGGILILPNVFACSSSTCGDRAKIGISVTRSEAETMFAFTKCGNLAADPAVFLLDVIKLNQTGSRTQWCSVLVGKSGMTLGRSWTYGHSEPGIGVEGCLDLTAGKYRVTVRGHNGGGIGIQIFTVDPAGRVSSEGNPCPSK